MSSNRPGDEAPFTWPPVAADMDRIDVLDVNQPGGVPVTETSPVHQPRLHRRRGRSRSHARAVTRATTGDGWLLLASGVLIGAMLPGLVQVHTSASTAPPAGTARASSLADTSPEGAALRAMQALLRGDTVAPAGGATMSAPAPAPPASDVGPTRAVLQQPPAQPTALPSPAQVTTTVAPPSRRPSPRRAAAASSPSARTTTNARDGAVRRVLQDYERAWTRMDTQAARALWPSVDNDTLQAEFRPVSEQRLQLAACDIGMSGDRALAVCLGTLRYRPRVGDTVSRVERGRWEFELQKSPVGWHISSVEHP